MHQIEDRGRTQLRGDGAETILLVAATYRAPPQASNVAGFSLHTFLKLHPKRVSIPLQIVLC